jgi:hypothetical protein
VLALGLSTTLVALHGSAPAPLIHMALSALALPIDSTRFFRGPEPPRVIDVLRLGVVGTATAVLVLSGTLPPSFVVEQLLSIVIPGDPTRWPRRDGPTP